MNISEQLTPGDIARELGVPLYRVNHVLSTRNIAPIGRVGITRIFDSGGLERIRAELAAIDARRTTASREGAK